MKYIKHGFKSKICINCNNEYTPSGAKQKYCNIKCSIEYSKDMRRRYSKTAQNKLKLNTDKLKEVQIKRSEYYQNNKELYRKNSENWSRKNRERKNELRNINRRRRRLTDPLFKLTENIRRLISRKIKDGGYTKKSKTFDILGCTYDFFKKFIEEKFQENMTWENYGTWHLDHIIPISSGKTEEQIVKLNHYSNFQPLWALDNMRKHTKII